MHVGVAEDDADGVRTVPFDEGADGFGDGVEGLVPGGLAQLSVAADEGVRSRSGSLSTAANAAPLGQMKPLLKTSSRSPRAPVTRPSSMLRVSPQVASHRGQIRRAVRDTGPPGYGGGGARHA
ncbi:hypothetical protein GCM10020256_62490 [Streptomyces thermocoprophilus]